MIHKLFTMRQTLELVGITHKLIQYMSCIMANSVDPSLVLPNLEYAHECP